MRQRYTDIIGMLQPDGLVISAAVLDELDLYVRQPLPVAHDFAERTPDDRLPSLAALTEHLGWTERFVTDAVDDYRLDLADLRATVSPTMAVHNKRKEPVLLVEWADHALDAKPPGDDDWSATRTERFERLLSQGAVHTGLLVCPTAVRLVYAPPGEAPGRLTFRVADLRTTDGRLLIDALHMLLGARRLIAPPSGKSLHNILRASRERQEQVTSELASQVQEALEVLLTGFDVAHERSGGTLLQDVRNTQLYDGLSTVLLRLVFLLYAEDRDLLPMHHPVYAEHYSVVALGEHLAKDAVSHGEAMHSRYGAWGRLCTLFRIVHDGAKHKELVLPLRRGSLFNPDAYPFLEGRKHGIPYSEATIRDLPRVSDAVVHGVLDRLLHLEGQRISYRNLEVEQLGSVYESLMGFEVNKAATPAVRLKSGVWVELGKLADAAQPYLVLQDITGQRNAKLRKQVPELGKVERTGEPAIDRHHIRQALAPLLPSTVTTIEPGRHYLQPGSERRSSGSHYTPRSLTEPLVRRTLAPLLGDAPTPEDILALRVCDPAMGSGAFLAEVVRQLADALVDAWARAGSTPKSDVSPLLVAKRRVSEQCIYGVDKNPRAVQLARLSIWLITSSADLPFTFVDHNLKAGDALIGLTLEQVATFDFQPKSKKQASLRTPAFIEAAQKSTQQRANITAEQRQLPFHDAEHNRKVTWLDRADNEVADERVIADLMVGCAWDARTKTVLAKRLKLAADAAWRWYPNQVATAPLEHDAQQLRDAVPFRPFHWWLEFPEVFSGKTPGFDAIVGNPPFGQKATITRSNGAPYIKLLQTMWPHAHGNSDWAAYFFLRAYNIMRKGGYFALLASNTIKQGNTRDTGLRHLLLNTPTTILFAQRDRHWPTAGAAVDYDLVIARKGPWNGDCSVDGETVSTIASDLNPGEELPDPIKLVANANRCSEGSKVYGQGFVVDVEHALELLEQNLGRKQILKPYYSGRDLNNRVPGNELTNPPRFVIDFGEVPSDALGAWPTLSQILRSKVKPERERLQGRVRQYWWQFERSRTELYKSIGAYPSFLATSTVAKHLLIGRLPSGVVVSNKICAFSMEPSWPNFAVLQSVVHDGWVWRMSSTHRTDLQYTPSRCFETFPFPRPTPEQAEALAHTGEALYTARAEIQVAEQLGMTQVWNRLHDVHDNAPDIVRLRELRDAMDRAVLDAYGWSDLDPDDSATILTRLRKLNAERAKEEAQLAAEEAKKAKRNKAAAKKATRKKT